MMPDIDLRTAKEIKEFLKLNKLSFINFVKRNNITKYALNTRVSRYDMNEIMQVLAINAQKMQAIKNRQAEMRLIKKMKQQ